MPKRFNQTIILFLFTAFTGSLITSCRNQPATLFEAMSSNHTGIHFNNRIIENDSINPIDQPFLYNGGGIAAADFNNDGLQDLYFTGSMVANKLYLNKGQLQFEDITDISGATCEGAWSSGVSVVDINQDGWQDIYVCTLLKNNPARQTNYLYIHQGLNQEGLPTFKEQAASYGLADTSMCTQANFFDYDLDGDLDMYLLVTKSAQRDANEYTTSFHKQSVDTTLADADKLFRNDWNDSLKHPVFTNVSFQSGIRHAGYGLGVITADFNEDKWPDIYVANDFIGNDLLYINQKNGIFSEELNHYFKHTAMNAMGTDYADINNDALPDIITVDMNPADNFRKKKNLSGNSYFLYQNFRQGNYMYQYVRNTLHLNMGKKPGSNEHIFSDIGYLAGVAETDWSWNPSLADFDNDGWRDLLVTNGYPRDVTDHDFGMFREQKGPNASKKELIDQIPAIRISNFAFRNLNGYQFEEVTRSWGFDKPSFSNGAVYADLDNDGDLDYVVNNINDKASVYRNNLNDNEATKRNYIKVQLQGTPSNKAGIGATICIYTPQGIQHYINTPYRGYMSCLGTEALFGLGNTKKIDSLLILWPDGKEQWQYNLPVNQTLSIAYQPGSMPRSAPVIHPLFQQVAGHQAIQFRHQEADHIDFNTQRLLPHKLSQYGPPLVVGDINADGTDDVIIGGTGDFEAGIFLQQPDGRFTERRLPHDTGSDARRPEHSALLLFDANGDRYPDLYIATGSTEWPAGTRTYLDLLYLNDGKGNFKKLADAFPPSYTNNSCVRAADYDKDGDLDLFVGGRSVPDQYTEPAPSQILRNDTRQGKVRFTDVTQTVAPMLARAGLICDALWTDFDKDGQTDLLLAGEWMPITFLKQVNGRFSDVTAASGLASYTGWWNSLAAADLDNDGDIDYLAGNLGLNTYYRASPQHPARIYGGDFDKNGMYDIIPTLYLPDTKGNLDEFPSHGRNEHADQMPSLKKKFLSFKAFGSATIRDLLPKEALNKALVLEANTMSNGWLRNEGKGKFSFIPFPIAAQTAPMFGMQVADVNSDGYPDVIAVGNDFGTEVSVGHYDASNGWVLLGNGKGAFRSLTATESGFYVPGNAKGLAWLRKADGNMELVATQNQDSLLTFRIARQMQWISYDPAVHQSVEFHLPNNRRQAAACIQGATFASQGSSHLPLPSHSQRITVHFDNGRPSVLTLEKLKRNGWQLPLE